MAKYQSWNAAKIKDRLEAAASLGLMDAALVIQADAAQEAPLDEGTLIDSMKAFRGTTPTGAPAATLTVGGGGNTGFPIVPYAIRWHEEDANFQHGRKRRYLADPTNRNAHRVPALIQNRIGALGVKTEAK